MVFELNLVPEDVTFISLGGGTLTLVLYASCGIVYLSILSKDSFAESNFVEVESNSFVLILFTDT